MKKLKEWLKAMRSSVTVWLNGVLLAALPVFDLLRDQLPAMQEYVPANVYRYMGLTVVILNIVLASRRRVKAQAANDKDPA